MTLTEFTKEFPDTESCKAKFKAYREHDGEYSRRGGDKELVAKLKLRIENLLKYVIKYSFQLPEGFTAKIENLSGAKIKEM